MQEEKIELGEAEEAQKDFSGNYIESFHRERESEKFPGKLVDWEKKDNVLYFSGENSTLEVMVLGQDILRFRYGNDGYFEDDFSYAIDPNFKAEDTHFEIVENAGFASLIRNCAPSVRELAS